MNREMRLKNFSEKIMGLGPRLRSTMMMASTTDDLLMLLKSEVAELHENILVEHDMDKARATAQNIEGVLMNEQVTGVFTEAETNELIQELQDIVEK